MLTLLNIGNTHAQPAIWHDGYLELLPRIPTSELTWERLPQEYPVAAASVVPKASARLAGHGIYFLSAYDCGGLIDFSRVDPTTLGADRVANAIAAAEFYPLPALVVDDIGMGDPFFCKYLCPQGVLEGAIPLAATNPGIRAALGPLFSWKLAVLVAVVVLSVVFFRPFCKWVCPLGAFYGLMNKVSLLEVSLDHDRCVSCGRCAAACQMDVDVTASPNSAECIRCGKCIGACPVDALDFHYGLSLPGDKRARRCEDK